MGRFIPTKVNDPTVVTQNDLASLATKESPTLTGAPKTTTPSATADVKQIANVEYVKNQIAALTNELDLADTVMPGAESVGAVGGLGSSTQSARADHVHAMPGIASSTAAGFMSAADKTKLDTVAPSATEGAPSGSKVHDVLAQAVASAVKDFNNITNRNNTPVVPLTITQSGKAVDHWVNTDGSIDLSFQWGWGGCTFVGSADANGVLTVKSVSSGGLRTGMGISTGSVSASINRQLADVYIVEMISGTGGVGTYQLSKTVAVSEMTLYGTMNSVFTGSIADNVLTVTDVSAGRIQLGQSLSVAEAGTYISAYGTGNGGIGTYIVSKPQTLTSRAISGTIQEGDIDGSLVTIHRGDIASIEFDSRIVDIVNDYIYTTVPHGLANGQPLVYSASETTVGGLSEGATYYAVVSNPDSFSFFGSIAKNVLTVTAKGDGELKVGTRITRGASGNAYIVSLGTGNGGIGTYTLDKSYATAKDQLMVATQPIRFIGYTQNKVLTVTNMLAGSLTTGTMVTSGVQQNTYIVRQISGTAGGAGTYELNLTNAYSVTPLEMTGSRDNSLRLATSENNAVAATPTVVDLTRVGTGTVDILKGGKVYSFGSNTEKETTYVVPAGKYDISIPGIAADKAYSFSVMAYRNVDKNVNSAGAIYGTMARPLKGSENPYIPLRVPEFKGTLKGKVEDLASSTISASTKAFNNSNRRNKSTILAPSISLTGTSVDILANNTNGTVDLNFEWAWPLTGNMNGSVSADVLDVSYRGITIHYPTLIFGGTEENIYITRNLTGQGGYGTYKLNRSLGNVDLSGRTIINASSFNCTFANNADGITSTMTVTSVPTQALQVGMSVIGEGIVPGTYISDLDTGLGSTGSYVLNCRQNITSGTTVAAAHVASFEGYLEEDILTIERAVWGCPRIGDVVLGGTIANTRILSRLTGTDAVGTYRVSHAQNVGKRIMSSFPDRKNIDGFLVYMKVTDVSKVTFDARNVDTVNNYLYFTGNHGTATGQPLRYYSSSAAIPIGGVPSTSADEENGRFDGTCAFTGRVAAGSDVLTVSGIVAGSGYLRVGSIIDGVANESNLQITEFITGGGGNGTYRLSKVLGAAVSSSLTARTLVYAIADFDSVADFYGGIYGTTLTVTRVFNGELLPGMALFGSSTSDNGTYIVEQLTGATGKTGTYRVNNSLEVERGTYLHALPRFDASIAGNVLTVSNVYQGTLGAGMAIFGHSASGNGVTSNTYIVSQLSRPAGVNPGSTGTYLLNKSYATAVASATMRASRFYSLRLASSEANAVSGIPLSMTAAGTASTDYLLVGKTYALEDNTTSNGINTYYVPANKQNLTIYGLPADKCYTFAVCAYRDVDLDISSNGLITSSIIKPRLGSENPFTPARVALFTGTIAKGAKVSLTALPHGAIVPIGTIAYRATTTTPTGWLKLPLESSAGAKVSREVYEDLFNVIGVTAGAGDGSTTFDLPKATAPTGSTAYIKY